MMRRAVVCSASFSLLLLIGISYDTIDVFDQTNAEGVAYEKVCHQPGILPLESFRAADQ